LVYELFDLNSVGGIVITSSPRPSKRYNLFDDTYCSWGRYGNESENYSTEPELIAGVHVNSSTAIDSGWVIYISKSVRTYANTLSTLYLKAVNPQYGIQVWRTTLPAGDASTMTFMTAPTLFKVSENIRLTTLIPASLFLFLTNLKTLILNPSSMIVLL